MRKILVVDDNRAFAENLAEIVADSGTAEAIVAESGAEAISFLERGTFDVMVTDMRMPRMNGTQLIQRARQIDPNLPIVVITAFSGHDDLSTAMREGLVSVLPKPAPISQLLGLLLKARRPGVIAIVDDDVALVDNLTEILRERGFATVTAHSVSEIDRLGGAPGVALVDLRVPGGADGAAVGQVIARFPGIPVVVVTAFSSEVIVPSGVPVVEKPFDTQRLVETIEALFARRPR